MDERLKDIKIMLLEGKDVEGSSLQLDGGISYLGRFCVLDTVELKKNILNEAHKSKYAIHPQSTSIYHGLKR